MCAAPIQEAAQREFVSMHLSFFESLTLPFASPLCGDLLFVVVF